MKHETRSTPETLAFFLNAKGDPLDKYWSAIAKCEQLERERDELREALAEFCKEQDWACDEWKRQPHIARLFKLNKKP